MMRAEGEGDVTGAELVQPAAMPAKVVLVGASRSGKTSLARMMCSGRMSTRYHRTIGIVTYRKDVRVHADAVADMPGTPVELNIWDMAGQSDVQTLRESFFVGAVAGILMFASDDRESYLAVRQLKAAAEQEVRRWAGGGACFEWVLVQHKVDLLNTAATGGEREMDSGLDRPAAARDSKLVSVTEGRHLADALGGLQVFQTTITDPETLGLPFKALASTVYYRQLAVPTAFGASNPTGGAEASTSHPPAGLRFRDNVMPTVSASEFDGDELFLSIASNPDAPTNQPFKLHKPAAQGSAGTRKFKDEFKAEIYTFICLGLSFAIFVLTFYIILPAEGVEVDPIEKIGEVTEREAG